MECRIEADDVRAEPWVEIDAWGKRLAGKQAALDVEIGEWLLAAREADVHQRLGYASFLEYTSSGGVMHPVQRRLGLEGHAVAERLRVAQALRELPATRRALANGDRPWASVRELTRVAVPESEDEWLQATAAMTSRDVQRLVAGRQPGQLPSDPADPRLVRHVLRLEVSSEAFALFCEAVRSLQKTIDPQLGDEAALAEMARRVLGGPADDGRSPYQVALVQCEDCGRTWQQAAGDTVEVPAELVERADCDGQHIGRVDQSPAGPSPAGRSSRAGRATQTIPPATRRLVVRRDHGRCRVPGCRNSAWIEVHHLQLRSERGGHDPSNLACLCGAHHHRLHEGFLLVEGDAERELTFRHADGAVYGSGAEAQVVSVQGAAYGALRQLGFRETESKQALARVRSRVHHPTRRGARDSMLRSSR